MKNLEQNGCVNGALKSAAAEDFISRPSDSADSIHWRELRHPEHFVQFYESDNFLVECLGTFIGGGLGAGDGAIVIATPAHRAALAERLKSQGIDLKAVQARGQYV